MQAALASRQVERNKELNRITVDACRHMQERSRAAALAASSSTTSSNRPPLTAAAKLSYGAIRLLGADSDGKYDASSSTLTLKRRNEEDPAATSRYFVNSAKLQKITSNTREVDANASKQRQAIIKLLKDENKSSESTKFLNDRVANQASQKQAEQRIKSYKICLTEAGREAWPPTYESLYSFIAASICCDHPYAGIDVICSDVMAAYTKFDLQDKARINNILNRLRKKGIIGQKKQKRPLSLAMIDTLSPEEGEAEKKKYASTRALLLLAFYGAFRSKECNAMVYCEKGSKPPFGYIAASYDSSDQSLHVDMSNYVQKGGPSCARHVRIYCACSGTGENANKSLCLICNKHLRSTIKKLVSGFLLKPAVDYLMKGLTDQGVDNVSPHSCRIGHAVHQFLNGVQICRIIHHARWSDDQMVLYYTRNARKYARPYHWSDKVSFLDCRASEKPNEQGDKDSKPLQFINDVEEPSDDSFCSLNDDDLF